MTAAIDRASPSDVAMLAMGAGVPQRAGAVLLLGPGADMARAARLLGAWARSVPRLRRRLVRVPAGCGRPVWVDDPGFDIDRHVRHMTCPAPGDERALLDLAAAVLTGPSTPSRWQAVLVTGLNDGAAALIVALDHVLADGMGGLALLAALTGPAQGEPADPARPGPGDSVQLEPGGLAQPGRETFPQPPPSLARLAADAMAERVRALRRARSYWREARIALAATGGLRPPPAARCSLLRPTGPRRTFSVVRTRLDPVRDAARRNGCTVNDALLTAVTGALRELLRRRGEHVETLVISVPVAARAAATAGELGNRFGVMIADLPATGGARQRMRRIGRLVAGRRKAAAQASAANLFAPLFRLLAGLGLHRWYLRRQRRIHTLVSNVRGPDRPLEFAGTTITGIIPVAVSENGNANVSFEMLSYDGTIAITLIADPDGMPDLDVLTALLREEVAAITTMRDNSLGIGGYRR